MNDLTNVDRLFMSKKWTVFSNINSIVFLGGVVDGKKNVSFQKSQFYVEIVHFLATSHFEGPSNLGDTAHSDQYKFEYPTFVVVYVL